MASLDAQPTLSIPSPLTASTVSNAITIKASATALVGMLVWGCDNAVDIASITGVTANGIAMMPLVSNLTTSNGIRSLSVYVLASPPTGSVTLTATCVSGGTLANNVGYFDAASFLGTDRLTATCFPAADVVTDVSTLTSNSYPVTPFSVDTASGDIIMAIMGGSDSTRLFNQSTKTILRASAASLKGDYSSSYGVASGPTTTQFGCGTGSGTLPAIGAAFRIMAPVLYTLINVG